MWRRGGHQSALQGLATTTAFPLQLSPKQELVRPDAEPGGQSGKSCNSDVLLAPLDGAVVGTVH